MALKEMTSFQNEGHLLPSAAELHSAYTYLLPKAAGEKAEDTAFALKEKGTSCNHLGQIFNDLLVLMNVCCPLSKDEQGQSMWLVRKLV